MRERFQFGVAVLMIASGILTAITNLPLLYIWAGTIRDQNFNPVPASAIMFFVLQFVAIGLIVVAAGVLLLAVPKWGLAWSVIALALSVNNLRASVLGSTGILIISSIMGMSSGGLGMLLTSQIVKSNKTTLPSKWFRTFPFALLVVGLWESIGIFLTCGPPDGIGQGGCELLGPAFYAVSTVSIAGVVSALGTFYSALVAIWSQVVAAGKVGS